MAASPQALGLSPQDIDDLKVIQSKLKPTDPRRAKIDTLLAAAAAPTIPGGEVMPDTQAQAQALATRPLSPTTQAEAAGIGFEKMGGTGRPISPEAMELFRTEGVGGMIENAPTAVGIGASLAGGGLPLLTRAGIAGVAAGGTKAAMGGTTEESLLTGAVQGIAPELGAGGAGFLAKKLTPMAARALSRILGLGEKSVMFGREPAEEVLRQGIKGGSVPTLVENIGKASRETTAQLDTLLQSAKGTVDAQTQALQVAASIPNSSVASRFLQLVDDAASKLGLTNLGKLTASQANALKREIAKSAKFVEGDIKVVIGNANKEFGGRLKDGIIAAAPEAEQLLETSANLTEASKAGQAMLRKMKVGKAPVSVSLHKPGTIGRGITDTTIGVKTLFKAAEALSETTSVSNALRVAFRLVFPQSSGAESDEP